MSQATPLAPKSPILREILASVRPHPGWLLYLVVTSVAIGGILIPLLYVPLRALAFLFPRLRPLPDAIMVWGVTFLMRIQVWMHLEMDLSTLEPILNARPAKGCLLVSNHRSHLDTFLLLSRVPGIRLLAKRTLFFVPLLGLVMWISGQIPVRRNDLRSFLRALDRIDRALRDGIAVHVFPEMTRCEPGARTLAPFTLAPFARAIECGVPIVPIVLCGTDRAWPKGSYGIRSGMKVRLVALPPLYPQDYPSAEALTRAAREKISERLRDLMNLEESA